MKSASFLEKHIILRCVNVLNACFLMRNRHRGGSVAAIVRRRYNVAQPLWVHGEDYKSLRPERRVDVTSSNLQVDQIRQQLQKDIVEIGSFKLEELTNQQLHLLCAELATWEESKRLLSPRAGEGFLAQFVPRKQGEPPNARLDAQLAFLYIAVVGMEPTKEKAAFTLLYLRRVRNIKKLCAELNLSRQTFYNYVRKFRKEAYVYAQYLERTLPYRTVKGVEQIVD